MKIKMKVYSSKKVALNNLPKGQYRAGLYSAGKFKSTIKEIETHIDGISAFYKTYGTDEYGRYAKIHCIEKVEQ